MPETTLESLGFTTVAREPSSKWTEGKSILTGIPKCGKTSLLAQGGELTFFFRLAPEFANLRTFGQDCKDFNDCEKWVNKLAQAQAQGLFKWETLVFDPADRLLSFIADAVCQKFGAESIGEIPHGKGWSAYKSGIEGFIYGLEKLPAHKFFVFHSVTKQFAEPGQEDSKNPRTYVKEVADLSEKTESAFLRWVDNILHVKVGYVGSQYARTILTRGTKHIEAGSKVPSLQSHPQIQWGKSDLETYQTLRGLFT